ncbi:MAG TPA: sulfite exporter TauE/SafE family protein, partial [Candidatus Saccharimonadia bacterium]|nr:sulfite exporter TauE/SafE family protein [Candidatus Saccharimonadia bacterium]
MEWQKPLVVAGAGFLAGMMNAVAGGGTMVTFPVLLWAGLNTMQANITSTVALFPGMPLSAWTFRRHIGPLSSWLRKLAPVVLLGGLAGGVLLIQTGSRVFDFIVPWLLLLATILFMCNGVVQRWLSRRQAASLPPGEEGKAPEPQLHLWSVFILAAVAVYGGYFGAGIGIMMLATLGLLGLRDINQMNAL